MSFDLNLSWGDISSKTNYKEKGQGKKDYKDERFWTLSRDEQGKGAAIIRLLTDKDKVPFISVYNCGLREFNETDKKYYWYIRDLPSTIKAPDPLEELWGALYNHSADGREEARNFGRRESFITNILVVKDPGNPENNGKIFLWKFGKKLLDKFMTALNPSEQERELGEKPKELFHPMKGNNIALKIKNVAGFPNYDDTSIQNASAVFDSEDDAKEAILSKTHSLKEFCSPESFEDYNKLKEDLVKFCKKYTAKKLPQETFDKIVSEVFGVEVGSSYTPKVAKSTKDDGDEPWAEAPAKAETKAPKAEKPAPKKESKPSSVDDSDIDDLLEGLDI